MAAIDTNMMLIQILQRMEARRQGAEERAQKPKSSAVPTSRPRTREPRGPKSSASADLKAADERARKAEERAQAAEERSRRDMQRMFQELQGRPRSATTRSSTDRFPSLKIDCPGVLRRA